MSFTFLVAREGESLEECSSDTPQFALWKLSPIAARCSSKGSGTESCPDSQFGTTFAPSMESRGVDMSMLFAEDSPAKTSAREGKEQASTERGADCGRRWREWFAKWHPATYSWRTRQGSLFEDCGELLETFPPWATIVDGECFHAEMSVDTTFANESGFLLPTIGKNEFKGTSSKRWWGSPDFRGAKMAEGVRTLSSDPIYLSPSFSEEAMMWPITWTALAPLETAKFQQWLSSHGKLSSADLFG